MPPTLTSIPGLGLGSQYVPTSTRTSVYPSYQRGTYTTLLRTVNDEISASRAAASMRASSASGATRSHRHSQRASYRGGADDLYPTANTTLAGADLNSHISAKERALDIEMQNLLAQQHIAEQEAERKRTLGNNEAERIRMLELAREIELERQKRQEAAADRLIQKERELEEWKLGRMKVAEQERLAQLAEEERQRQLSHERELARLREAQQVAAAAAAATVTVAPQALLSSPQGPLGNHYEQTIERLVKDLREREERTSEESRRREREFAAKMEELEVKRMAELMDLKREIEKERSRHEDVQKKLERIERLGTESTFDSAGAASPMSPSATAASLQRLKQQFDEDKLALERRHRAEIEQQQTDFNRVKHQLDDAARTEIRRRDDQIFELERKNRVLTEQLSEAERKVSASSFASPSTVGFLGNSPTSRGAHDTHTMEELNRLRDELRQMVKQRDEESSAKKTLQMRVEDLTARCEALTRSSQQSANDLRSKEQQHYDELRKLRDERDTLERELGREKHNSANLTQDMERAKRDAIDQLRKELESGGEQALRKATLQAEEDRRRFERERTDLLDKISLLERDNRNIQSNLEKERSSLSEKIKVVEQEHSVILQKQVAATNEALAKYNLSEAELRDYKSRLADTEASFERMEAAFKTLRSEKESAEAAAKTALQDKTREVSELQGKLAAALDQSNSSSTYNSEIQKMLTQKDDEIKALVEQIQLLKNEKNAATTKLQQETFALQDATRKLAESEAEVVRLRAAAASTAMANTNASIVHHVPLSTPLGGVPTASSVNTSIIAAAPSPVPESQQHVVSISSAPEQAMGQSASLGLMQPALVGYDPLSHAATASMLAATVNMVAGPRDLSITSLGPSPTMLHDTLAISQNTASQPTQSTQPTPFQPQPVQSTVAPNSAPDLSQIPIPGAPALPMSHAPVSQVPDLSTIPVPGASHPLIGTVSTPLVHVQSQAPVYSSPSQAPDLSSIPVPAPAPSAAQAPDLSAIPIPGVSTQPNSTPGPLTTTQAPDLSTVPIPLYNTQAPDLSKIPVPGSAAQAPDLSSIPIPGPVTSQAPDLSAIPIPGPSASTTGGIAANIPTVVANLNSSAPAVVTVGVPPPAPESATHTDGTETAALPVPKPAVELPTVTSTSASYQPPLADIPIPGASANPLSMGTAATSGSLPTPIPTPAPAPVVAVPEKVYYWYTNPATREKIIVQGPPNAKHPDMEPVTVDNAPAGFDKSLLGGGPSSPGVNVSPQSPQSTTDKDKKDKKHNSRERSRDRDDHKRDKRDKHDKDRDRDKDSHRDKKDKDRDRDRDGKDKDKRDKRDKR